MQHVEIPTLKEEFSILYYAEVSYLYVLDIHVSKRINAQYTFRAIGLVASRIKGSIISFDLMVFSAIMK